MSHKLRITQKNLSNLIHQSIFEVVIATVGTQIEKSQRVGGGTGTGGAATGAHTDGCF
jgi:hypothetical protein